MDFQARNIFTGGHFKLAAGKVEVKPIRDGVGAAAAVAGSIIDWGARGPFALLAFVGPAIKKSLISADSSIYMKFAGGVASLLFGGVTGLVGYLAAAPRSRADQEVLETRGKVVAGRIGSAEPQVTVSTSRTAPAFHVNTAAQTPSRAPDTSRPVRVPPSAATINLSPGQQAARTWLGEFDSLLANSKAWTISEKDGPEYARWLGQTVRIVKAETDKLKGMIDTAIEPLPLPEAKVFHDAIADRLNGMQGSQYEKERTFRKLLEHASEALEKKTVAEPSVPPTTGTTPATAAGAGAKAATAWLARFELALSNPKAWTISEKDGPEFAKWLGQTVRVVKAEAEALKAEIDKIYAELPASEAKAFRDGVAARLENIGGSEYEMERTFRKLLEHLNEGYASNG